MKSEQTISMLQILRILRKHIKAILFSTIIVGLMSAFASFYLITPKYSATTEILVNRKLSSQMQGAQFQQAQADVQMISTYKDIITSPTVLREVNKVMKDKPGYPGTVSKLKKVIKIDSSQNSQVFSVTTKLSNAKTAAKTSNEIAKVFKNKIGKIMSINNVSIVSEADITNKPVSPRKTINIIAGIVIGILLGIVVAFLIELNDRTVRSERFITDDLGLRNLGFVSEIKQRDIVKNVKRKKAKLVIGTNQNRNTRRV
ncbi:YveK family protein [Companilactobacillus mishanensis]|nr:Wzz/FepE/Etk N-terminal domain-containing protein [Companilactobacillus mishanensis]